MRSLFFVICLMVSSTAFSQNQSSAQLQENLNNLATDGYRGMVFTYDTRYSGVKGSPFLNEEWFPGKLYLSSGDSLPNKALKLDIYQNELILHQGNSDNYVKKEMIEAFELTDKSKGMSHTFVKADHPKKDDPQYFQRLVQGEAELLIYHEAQLKKADYKGAYSTGVTYDQFIPGEEIYARLGSSGLQKIKTRKKQVIKFFPDRHDAIEAYLNDNNLNLSDKEDLAKVFAYYNELVE